MVFCLTLKVPSKIVVGDCLIFFTIFFVFSEKIKLNISYQSSGKKKKKNKKKKK